jgi:oxazoline/thiazoline synthase
MPVVIEDRTLRLRPHLRHYIAPELGVFLLSERESYLLPGAVYQELIPLLDGGDSVSGIADLLASGRNPVEIYSALDSLRRKGYIEEQNDRLPIAQAAFWQATGTASASAAALLRENPVRIMAVGGLDAGPLRELLLDSSVRVDAEAKRWVVLTSGYLHSEVEDIAREARLAGIEWLICKPVGTEVWIGPVFGANCCWHCMAHRLRGHRKVETYLGLTETAGALVPQLPATLHLGLAVAVTRTAGWIVEPSNCEMEGTIVTLDVRTLRQTRHTVTRRPQCPACGNPALVAERQLRPMALTSRRGAQAQDGGYRIQPPEETERKLASQISPLTGIAGAIHSNLPAGFPAWVQSYTAAGICGRRSFQQGRAGRPRSAGGKGVLPAQARVSALAEAIERYSGESQGDEARLTASWRALAGEAIHPNACMLFSESQYAARQEINTRESAVETIPEPLDETAEIEWSPLWPLDGGPVRYLPTSYCFYDAGGEGARFASAGSNGCAAGACREEAILQGFLELVERDAVAMWWYNRVRRPSVDLPGFQQSFFDEMVAYHRSINRDVWVLDVTSDLRIPVFAAVSRRTDKEAEDILIGFGAHLDARIAIQRALTEVNQSLPAVISVDATTPDAYAGQNPAAISWWQSATLRSEPYLAAADCPPAALSSHSHAATNFILEDVMECVRRAGALGLRVFALDQTRPDTGLDVVKVIVPGMRHFRPRFAPGRLYDVPVDLGWLKEPTNEHELNRHCPYF